MINQLLQVGAFMTKFGQDIRTSPASSIFSDTLRLRIMLSQEEMNEFLEAFTPTGVLNETRVHKAKALDALCDRLYVLLGDAHALGLAYLLPVAFRIVHQSNMSKLWTEAEIKVLTPDYTVKKVANDVDRQYLVHDPLGKVLKSPSYCRANLQDLIDELEGQELLDYHHASSLIFGEEPEPDVDEDYSPPKKVSVDLDNEDDDSDPY